MSTSISVSAMLPDAGRAKRMRETTYDETRETQRSRSQADDDVAACGFGERDSEPIGDPVEHSFQQVSAPLLKLAVAHYLIGLLPHRSGWRIRSGEIPEQQRQGESNRKHVAATHTYALGNNSAAWISMSMPSLADTKIEIEDDDARAMNAVLIVVNITDATPTTTQP
jgi:hypothetical protein